MTAAAFDLTERLQTPVIVMTDLDLGMNDHVTEPLAWDDSRPYDRGKVLTTEQLDRISTASLAGTRSSSLHEADNPGDGNGNGTRHNAADLPGHDGSSETAGEPLQQFRGKFGRYLDIDDDGIPYRTIPGTHASRGAFVTRGSSRDEYAVYTEDGEAYRRNVDRLARKWETAKELVPQPEFYVMKSEGERKKIEGLGSRDLGDASISFVPHSATLSGVIFFGTSSYAAEEAIELLAAEGVQLDAMRVRGFPFGRAFRDFVDSHDRIFVIEQNRDAQFRSLMMIELGVDPAKLVSVLNYDGTPITAENIFRQIKTNIDG